MPPRRTPKKQSSSTSKKASPAKGKPVDLNQLPPTNPSPPQFSPSSRPPVLQSIPVVDLCALVDSEDSELDFVLAKVPVSHYERIVSLLSGKDAEGRDIQIKGSWTEEEDRTLLELVKTYGNNRWSFIASHLKGRVGKQCRERYLNHLDPNINKAEWSNHEDRVIIQMHEELGNQWAKISQRLPGRTANAVKNHWNSTLKRRLPERKRELEEAAARGELTETVPSETATTTTSSIEEYEDEEEEEEEDEQNSKKKHVYNLPIMNKSVFPIHSPMGQIHETLNKGPTGFLVPLPDSSMFSPRLYGSTTTEDDMAPFSDSTTPNENIMMQDSDSKKRKRDDSQDDSNTSLHARKRPTLEIVDDHTKTGDPADASDDRHIRDTAGSFFTPSSTGVPSTGEFFGTPFNHMYGGGSSSSVPNSSTSGGGGGSGFTLQSPSHVSFELWSPKQLSHAPFASPSSTRSFLKVNIAPYQQQHGSPQE